GRNPDRYAAEGAAELDHRAVEVRMGDRDRGDAASVANGRDGLVVAEADRFPEQVADRRADQVPLLANREGRPGVDRRQARLGLPELVAAPAGPQPLGRRPPLPVVANVLPLVLTDRAMLRGDVRMLRHRRELNATGLADECSHGKVLLDLLCLQSEI